MDELKIVMFGTGWFARHHAELLSKRGDAKIVGFCGTGLEKASALASSYPGASGYADAGKMLDDCRPDAAYICVPPDAHGAIEEALLERGIPFLVEKPLGLDLELPKRISKGIKEKGLITSVGYHFRYMDGVREAKRLLADRTVAMAVGAWMGDMPGVGWWRRQEGSGGQFVEQATHIIDLLRYMVGEVSEVYAAAAQRVMHQKHDGVTVDDVNAATLKLANGAVATITNTCVLPSGYKAGLEIYTDQGVLELSHAGLKVHGSSLSDYPNEGDPYEAENEAFLKAIRTGDSSGIRSTYEDALHTQAVAVAGVRSAASGLPVKISELL